MGAPCFIQKLDSSASTSPAFFDMDVQEKDLPSSLIEDKETLEHVEQTVVTHDAVHVRDVSSRLCFFPSPKGSSDASRRPRCRMLWLRVRSSDGRKPRCICTSRFSSPFCAPSQTGTTVRSSPVSSRWNISKPPSSPVLKAPRSLSLPRSTLCKLWFTIGRPFADPPPAVRWSAPSPLRSWPTDTVVERPFSPALFASASERSSRLLPTRLPNSPSVDSFSVSESLSAWSAPLLGRWRSLLLSGVDDVLVSLVDDVGPKCIGSWYRSDELWMVRWIYPRRCCHVG